MAVVFMLWMTCVIGFVILKTKNTRPELPVLGQVPSFSLTDQSGQVFKSEGLSGKVWIADFIFTRCSGPCPMMSYHLERIQQKLLNEDAIRLVSFSVDPEWDSPEVLHQYAAGFQAKTGKWFFLTGDQAVIYPLSMQHFKLGVGREVTPEDDLKHAVMHSTRFVLVDQKGAIRGYYDSADETALNRLVQDAAELAHKGHRK